MKTPLIQNETYFLRSSLVNRGKLGLGTIKPPIGILVVPAQVNPALARVVLLNRIDFLESFVPFTILGRGRLPIVLSDVRVSTELWCIGSVVFFLRDDALTPFLLFLGRWGFRVFLQTGL